MKRGVPLIICLVIVGACIFLPALFPTDPMLTDPQAQLSPPGPTHIFGTDLLGRDVLSRTLHGGKRSLFMAAAVTVLVVTVGLPVGAGAGAITNRYLGQGVLTLLNAILAIPSLILALVVITIMGGGMWGVIVAVSIAQVAPFASVIRSAVLTVRSAAYIEAAHSFGANQVHVFLHHILPGIRPTLLSYGSVMFAYGLLNAAALTFLGLGGEPGIPDWGVMLAEGRAAFRVAPWIALAPGLAITLTVWSVNSLADQMS